MPSSPPPGAVDRFWTHFRDHHGELERLNSADDPAYDAMLIVLQKIDPGLFIEFSTGPGEHGLVITAEGDRDLFPLAEAVVAQAPVVVGWSFRALKPKLGFPDTATWEGFTVRIAEVVFDPLVHKDGLKLALRLYVPGLEGDQVQDAHAAIVRAIDHGLGERRFAEQIDWIEVLPLPESESAEPYIPLSKLEDYLDWRERKRRG